MSRLEPVSRSLLDDFIDEAGESKLIMEIPDSAIEGALYRKED